mgnify:FL=1
MAAQNLLRRKQNHGQSIAGAGGFRPKMGSSTPPGLMRRFYMYETGRSLPYTHQKSNFDDKKMLQNPEFDKFARGQNNRLMRGAGSPLSLIAQRDDRVCRCAK